MLAISKCRVSVLGLGLLAIGLSSGSAQAQTPVVVYEPAPPPPPPQRRVLEPLDRIQLGAQVGWLFGSNIETVDGDVGLVGNLAYTGNLDFRLPSVSTLLELSYTYLPTELEFDPFVGPNVTLTDVSVHYFQIGAHQELPFGVVRPFIGITFGATYFDPDVDLYDGETYFSNILLAGVKLVPSERVGVRLQARLPYTWTGTSSTLFCGGGGCSYGYVGDGILQLDLSAGVFVMF